MKRVYRQLYNTNLYLTAYGRIYRNAGAMTPGVTEETADGISLETFDTIIQQCGRNDINGNQHDEPTSRRKTGKEAARYARLERQASG